MSENKLPTFSIIVPTYRRLDVLGETLQALIATDYPPRSFEIVVVDDAADYETQSVIDASAQGSPVRVTRIDGSGRGAAAARNLGAASASSVYLVFVDDDIIVPRHHLAAQLETRAEHGECISGADWWEFTPEVAAELRSTPLGRYRLAVEAGYRRPSAERWTAAVGLATAHLTLRRDLFDDLGRFDERFPKAGAEDWEFCLRARDHGCKLILDNSLSLLHNDRRLTLDQFCRREEWRGASVGVLAALRPDLYDESEVVRENSPIRPEDNFALRVRKLIKQGLGQRRMLSLLHAAVSRLAPALKYEPLLHRLYRGVISVHYLRGFRQGVASERVDATQDATARTR
jgi:glycosyltransferase involved in cell wall biosynthesis